MTHSMSEGNVDMHQKKVEPKEIRQTVYVKKIAQQRLIYTSCENLKGVWQAVGKVSFALCVKLPSFTLLSHVLNAAEKIAPV